MTDILKQLSNPKQAKKLFKDANEKQISAVISTLENLKNEKVIEAQIEAENAKKEQQELEALKAQILDQNIDFEKLTALMGTHKKPRKTARKSSTTPSVRYVYDGDKVWNGVGEIPPSLQSHIDEGFELSDFLSPQ